MKTPTTHELMEAERLCRREAAIEKRIGKIREARSPERAIRERSARLFTVAADCISKQIKRRIADRKRRAKR